jgi:hypothetical protein
LINGGPKIVHISITTGTIFAGNNTGGAVAVVALVAASKASQPRHNAVVMSGWTQCNAWGFDELLANGPLEE